MGVLSTRHKMTRYEIRCEGEVKVEGTGPIPRMEMARAAIRVCEETRKPVVVVTFWEKPNGETYTDRSIGYQWSTLRDSPMEINPSNIG